jgi:hypothetical protein
MGKNSCLNFGMHSICALSELFHQDTVFIFFETDTYWR